MAGKQIKSYLCQDYLLKHAYKTKTSRELLKKTVLDSTGTELNLILFIRLALFEFKNTFFLEFLLLQSSDNFRRFELDPSLVSTVDLSQDLEDKQVYKN